eukprot:gnl/MRDRNA2_/MRDRNA2_157777_c0_seq1.p1 gnl/MRDRNA2_/MRDRNA2_157777_c0~~gnl/MRDRNA2_/MRDRNA2_157777_c0_seq1.p1  ORF type:complete len:249 (+),score=46.51 gnl/MRDRNA2_/MRDRNA2_157777_c0_seq1:93-839(+)
MRIVILPAFIVNAHATEVRHVVDGQDFMDNMLDKLVDEFFDRALKMRPLDCAKLDNTPLRRLIQLRVTECRQEQEQIGLPRYHLQHRQQLPGRRGTFLTGPTLLSSVLMHAGWGSAMASLSDTAKIDKRPKRYLELSHELVDAVKDAIEFERVQGNAERSELKKRADRAQKVVTDWASQWRENPRVKREVSYKAIIEALQQLLAYYSKNGYDARLSEEVSKSVIELLNKADEDLGPLPMSEKTIAPAR